MEAPVGGKQSITVNFDEAPDCGLLRLEQVLAPRGPLPISRSGWWAGVASGRFPKPTYCLGPRSPCWRVRDIRDLIGADRQDSRTSPEENTPAAGSNLAKRLVLRA